MTPIRLRVRELREAKGWSQTQLAEKSGLRQATLSEIENDKVRRLDFGTLEALADAFGVDAAFLIVHEEKDSSRKRS